MASPKWPKGHNVILSTLNVVIQGSNLVKDAGGTPPVQALGPASTIPATSLVYFPLLLKLNFRLVFIQHTMANDQNYIELGQACTDACHALYWELKGRQLNALNQPVLHAIRGLTI